MSATVGVTLVVPAVSAAATTESVTTAAFHGYHSAAASASSSLWPFWTALVSAVVGGLLALTVAFVTTRLNHKQQARTLTASLLNDRLGYILPLRQKAIQDVWSVLIETRLAARPITEQERTRLVAQAIWLPAALRNQLILLLAGPAETAAITELQDQLARYLEGLEEA